MVLAGEANTLKVKFEHILYHTQLVSKTQPHSLIVSDMPFPSYHISAEKAVEHAAVLVQEGGAEAVKLEGGRQRFEVIDKILAAGIPVMGHLGLTPQSILRLGGFKVQGRQKEKAREIVEDAIELEKRGVFAIILESVPSELAKIISQSVSVPCIGIGAGPHCDGQILVFHDLIGFSSGYYPKFARQYMNFFALASQSVQHYIQDVKSGQFPNAEESVVTDVNYNDLLP
jgi:3-methyl-2-oxobutanoate hydroxymethyltransferase